MVYKCSRCGESKDESEFSPRNNRPGGRCYHCKACGRAARRKRYHSRSEERKELDRLADRARNQDPKRLASQRQRFRHLSPEKKRQYRERQTSYQRIRSKTDPLFKLRRAAGCRINLVLADRDAKRADSYKNLIGCEWAELKAHLEKQFKPDMSWENHGDWHIDHVRSCSLFDLHNPEEQRRCLNFSNLQPLWSEEHFKKNKSDRKQVV